MDENDEIETMYEKAIASIEDFIEERYGEDAVWRYIELHEKRIMLPYYGSSEESKKIKMPSSDLTRAGSIIYHFQCLGAAIADLEEEYGKDIGEEETYS